MLTEGFRRPGGGDVDVIDFVADLHRSIPLGPLRAVIAEAMRKFEFEPPKSDPWLGPRIHATLRLTRREAAEKDIWAYLSVVEFADYVRWRWPPLDEETPIPFDRFVGHENVNALGRLWWATELVRNGPDYQPAVDALKINRFYMWQKLNFVHHKAGAVAAVRFLTNFGEKGATNDEALEMAKALNMAVRTVSLDAIAASPAPDAQAVRDWIAAKVDETTMMGDELPEGPDEAQIPEPDLEAVRLFLEALAARIELTPSKGTKRSESKHPSKHP